MSAKFCHVTLWLLSIPNTHTDLSNSALVCTIPSRNEQKQSKVWQNEWFGDQWERERERTTMTCPLSLSPNPLLPFVRSIHIHSYGLYSSEGTYLWPTNGANCTARERERKSHKKKKKREKKMSFCLTVSSKNQAYLQDNLPFGGIHQRSTPDDPPCGQGGRVALADFESSLQKHSLQNERAKEKGEWATVHAVYTLTRLHYRHLYLVSTNVKRIINH